MGFIKKRNEDIPSTPAASVQTSRQNQNPFAIFDRYVPFSQAQLELYSALREAVPIIDAAILKLVRLIGKFDIICEDEKSQRAMDTFYRTVNVNGLSMGLDSFIYSYFEQLLTYGTAVGEIVTAGGKIAALYNARLSDIDIVEGDNPLDIRICSRDDISQPTPVKYPQLILLSLMNPQEGQLYGNSMLRGLPFISSVLTKIYNTIGENWDRAGNVRFAVTYKPQNDSADRAFAKERALQVAKEWGEAMHSNGTVKDFIAVGDVQIKAIGADNQILDSEVPVRQLLEQIISKTGLPPFMLGLSWSSTERMSAQQSDVLTSELEAYRRILDPVIRKICDIYLRLEGLDSDFKINWDFITLQDEVELSRAKLYNAQADRILMEIEGMERG